jgi:SAM-dependent methyltransferase
MLKKLINWIRKIALKGGNVYCCICEKSYLTFLPSGDEPKAHARCPGCNSIDRHRQLYNLSNAFIAQNRAVTALLHIAPEFALGERFRRNKQVNYFAIDKFESGYQYPNYVQAMDITDLKFQDNSFDLILCSHVLEHIEQDTLAIQNLLKVLKPTGICYIVVPYFPELEKTYHNPDANTDALRFLNYGQSDHVRKYGLDFGDRLAKVGFRFHTINFKENYSVSEQIKLGFLNAEIIFQITKNG